MLILAACSGFSRAWDSPKSRGALCARLRPGLSKRGPTGARPCRRILPHRPEQHLDDAVPITLGGGVSRDLADWGWSRHRS
jgi:hypothetical protein